MWWAKCHSLISCFHYLLKKKKFVLYKNFKFIIKSIEANQKSTEKKVKMMTSIPSSQNNHRTWLSFPHDWGPLISNKKRQLRLGFVFFLIYFYLEGILQYCVGFCHTTVWISHKSPPFRTLLPPLIPFHPSGCHRAPGWAPCVIKQLPSGCLFTRGGVHGSDPLSSLSFMSPSLFLLCK